MFFYCENSKQTNFRIKNYYVALNFCIGWQPRTSLSCQKQDMTAGFIVTLILCGLCAVIFGAYFYARATTPKAQERRNSSTHNAASPDSKIRKLRGAAAQRAARSNL